MKIKISNFAKILETEIVIDGITVIAGQNNSGKSTIGKIVFSLFNSLNNMEEKIEIQRMREINKKVNNIIMNYLEQLSSEEIDSSPIAIRRQSSTIVQVLTEKFNNSENEVLSYEEIYKIVFSLLENNKHFAGNEPIEDVAKDISNNVLTIMNIPNSLIMCEIINRYVEQIFLGQVNCLHNQDSDARLELTIKDKKLNINFKNNKCTNIDSAYTILHEAFYIDNPFIIDELYEHPYLRYAKYTENIKEHIIAKLTVNNGIMDRLFDAVIAKEKLEEINLMLNRVIDGKVIYGNDELKLDASNYSEPIKLNNLSTGLKSFLIIKILLEKGILKEKDVLILDEPEIHLHTEWQLIYAEIIVLLLKVFDLSIIVTTHSPHFLESIEYFSKKYNVDNKCRYYLSKVDNGLSSFKDVTGSLNEIYKQMVQPSILLDKLKNEMDNKDEEED